MTSSDSRFNKRVVRVIAIVSIGFAVVILIGVYKAVVRPVLPTAEALKLHAAIGEPAKHGFRTFALSPDEPGIVRIELLPNVDRDNVANWLCITIEHAAGAAMYSTGTADLKTTKADPLQRFDCTVVRQTTAVGH